MVFGEVSFFDRKDMSKRFNRQTCDIEKEEDDDDAVKDTSLRMRDMLCEILEALSNKAELCSREAERRGNQYQSIIEEGLYWAVYTYLNIF